MHPLLPIICSLIELIRRAPSYPVCRQWHTFVAIPCHLHLAYTAIQMHIRLDIVSLRLREGPYSQRYAVLRDNSFRILSVLPDSYATRYQRRYYGAMLPQYSTFSYFQAAAVLPGAEMESEENMTLPLYAHLLRWVAGILAVRAFFV